MTSNFQIHPTEPLPIFSLRSDVTAAHSAVLGQSAERPEQSAEGKRNATSSWPSTRTLAPSQTWTLLMDHIYVWICHFLLLTWEKLIEFCSWRLTTSESHSWVGAKMTSNKLPSTAHAPKRPKPTGLGFPWYWCLPGNMKIWLHLMFLKASKTMGALWEKYKLESWTKTVCREQSPISPGAPV